MEKELLKIGAILDSVSTRKDKSIKIVFETNEVSAQEAQAMFAMRDNFGWLCFSPSREAIEVPEEPPAEFQNQKSLSKRLYDVLFVWWKQLGEKEDFDSFRKAKMEKFIQWIKEKLEPEA